MVRKLGGERMTSKELSFEEAEALLSAEIAREHAGIDLGLAPYAPRSATLSLLDAIRGVEELVNLPMELEDARLMGAIAALPLVPLLRPPVIAMCEMLERRFSLGVARRFFLTVLQAEALGAAFREHGLLEAADGLATVGSAIAYLQSRRRHIVAMLYTLPEACCGDIEVSRIDALGLVLPLIELHGVALTGRHLQRMLLHARPDFHLLVDERGYRGSHGFEMLDPLFLEPTRITIEAFACASTTSPRMRDPEPTDPAKIFSAAELRNNILLTAEIFADFGLLETDYAAFAALAPALLEHCEDDYRIAIEEAAFDAILAGDRTPGAAALKAALVHRGGDYVANTNSFAPFVAVEGGYVSTVTLLDRFLYMLAGRRLEKKRRFQIRSGFWFEESVKAALHRQGFTVTRVKRVSRREFDVVAVLDGVIYNIQCKNNALDQGEIEAAPVRYGRRSRRLARYYARALDQEEARSALLCEELGLHEVRCFLVSRFPIAAADPRIIPFNAIGRFRALVSGADA